MIHTTCFSHFFHIFINREREREREELYLPQILVLLRKGKRACTLSSRENDMREYCSPILRMSAAIMLEENFVASSRLIHEWMRSDARNDGCGNIICDAHTFPYNRDNDDSSCKLASLATACRAYS